MFKDGSSVNDICKFFMKNNILSPGGSKTWERGTVIRILRRETYIGYIRGNPAKNIEPIINEETYRTVQNILIARSPTGGRISKEDFLFGDVAYCGICKRKLFCKREAKPKARMYYVCSYNGSKHLKAGDEGAHSARMEESTFERLFLSFFENFKVDLNNSEIKADEKKLTSIKKIIEALDKRKEVLTKRKNRSLERYMDNLITDVEYHQISKSISDESEIIDQKIREQEKEREQLQLGNTSEEYINKLIKAKQFIAECWDDINTKQKRLLISTTIKKIEVVRGRIALIEFR